MPARIPARVDLFDAKRFGPDLQAMAGLGVVVRKSTLEPALRELVKIRVSQINGCAFCLDMHSKDARAAGETEQRLYVLDAWRESPFYTERERAALDWAETLTRIEHEEVPDEFYERTRRVFSEEELVALTLAVVEINGWNRIAIAFRAEPGVYRTGSIKRE
jgi:AhpD family alkylhydroperoxidase